MDIKEKLMLAFDKECPELLVRIQATLNLLGKGSSSTVDWQETFRAAHSLKGAARVCDLREIESIGAALQIVFGKARDGRINFSEEDRKTIIQALEAVERCSTVARNGGTLPDTNRILQSLEQITEKEKRSNSIENKPTNSSTESQADNLNRPIESESTPNERNREHPSTSMDQRLLTAFNVEHAEHLEAIRQVIDSKNENGSTPSFSNSSLNEIFRRAHSIKGAARVTGLSEIEQLAHELESFFGSMREGRNKMSKAARRVVCQALDVIEDLAASAHFGKPAPDSSQVLEELRTLACDGTAFKHGASKSTNPQSSNAPSCDMSEADSFRVEATALDTILDTANSLTTACHGLGELNNQLDKAYRTSQEIQGLVNTQLNRDVLGSSLPIQQIKTDLDTLVNELSRLRRRQQASGWAMAQLSGELKESVIQARMTPAASVFQSFRKMVRDLAQDEGKQVDVQFIGLDVKADRLVYQPLKDPVMHLLRNAVSHGVEPVQFRRNHGKSEAGTITLRVASVANRLEIQVEDDGPGIDIERVRELAVKRGLLDPENATDLSDQAIASFIFHPDFSTSSEVSEVSGRGMGMSIVHEATARLGGKIEIDLNRRFGTSFRINVPLSLATQKIIGVRCFGREYALPLRTLSELDRVRCSTLQQIGGQPYLRRPSGTIPLISLSELLGEGDSSIGDRGEWVTTAIVSERGRQWAVAIDEFLDSREVVVKELPAAAGVHAGVMGAIISDQGEVSLVLNLPDLLNRFRNNPLSTGEENRPNKTKSDTTSTRTILMVDDSFTSRTLVKGLLESQGYNVLIAVDGSEGLRRMRNDPVDLAVSDIEMPKMDGLTMLQEIRKETSLRSTPVILMSSVEDQKEIDRSFELGAAAYIVKRKFDHGELLETIRKLL